MKTIQKQVKIEDGHRLKFEAIKIYPVGASYKAWLPVSISKPFLEGYEFDRVLAVFDDDSKVLILYRIRTKQEFEELFKYANSLRSKL